MNDFNNASSVGVLFWVVGRLPNRPADLKDAVLRGWDAPGRRVQRSYPETVGSPDIVQTPDSTKALFWGYSAVAFAAPGILSTAAR